MKSNQTSRRRFLQALTATVAGAPHLISSSALGRDGAIAPSGRVALGWIGFGRRGRETLPGFLSLPDAQVVAV